MNLMSTQQTNNNDVSSSLGVATQQPKIKIKVEFEGFSHKLYFSFNTSLKLVKVMKLFIDQAHLSTTPDALVFTLDGNRLNKDKTASEYNMIDGDKIFVVERTDGGSY